MLADHLDSGDYAITWAAFVAVLELVVGVVAASIVIVKGWPRVIGLAISAILAFVATRMHFRWEDVTNAADRMTQGKFQLSELDDFARTVFGGGAVLLVLWMLLIMLVAVVVRGRHHSGESEATRRATS
jgi:hypothetical protein